MRDAVEQNASSGHGAGGQEPGGEGSKIPQVEEHYTSDEIGQFARENKRVSYRAVGIKEHGANRNPQMSVKFHTYKYNPEDYLKRNGELMDLSAKFFGLSFYSASSKKCNCTS